VSPYGFDAVRWAAREAVREAEEATPSRVARADRIDERVADQAATIGAHVASAALGALPAPEAPCWYSADAAQAWQAGYEAAVDAILAARR